MTITPVSVPDLDALVGAVRAKAEAEPDHVYQAVVTAEDDEGQVDTDCLYVERDVAGNLCGSCLVGHGLLEVGVPAEFLDRPVIGIAELLAHEWGFDRTGAKVRWLEEVQNAQDTGLPWARAIEKADSEVEE